MKKLLHIIATPRGDESRTLQVSEVFLASFKESHPDWVMEELDLGTENLPALTMRNVGGKYVLLSGKDLFGELKEAWEEILVYIQQFLTADLYLISAPMWNFNIPYMLKHYIDLIVQPKYLFRYSEGGEVEGLARNKKMVVISSRGGTYESEESKAFDLQEPYLRRIFGFVGITDISFIVAQPTDRGIELQKQKIREAQEAAYHLAQEI